MKYWLNVILFSLLTTASVQLLHAAESSKGASLFTNEIEEDEFLPPDVAFKLDVSAKDASNLTANFKIVPGYYLYKQRITFKDANGQGLTAKSQQLTSIQQKKVAFRPPSSLLNKVQDQQDRNSIILLIL